MTHRSKRFSRTVALVAALIVGCWVYSELATTTVRAATFVVDSVADYSDANLGDGICASSLGECTLRAAIHEANSLAGPDTIIVPTGTYPISVRLTISDDVTIQGDGAEQTIIDGQDITDIFLVGRFDSTTGASHLTLEDLTIANGHSDDSVIGAAGGIFVGRGSELTLNRIHVRDNWSVKGFGALYGTRATATISDSSFFNNGNERNYSNVGFDLHTNVTIRSTTFSNPNYSLLSVAYYTDLTIEDSTFIGDPFPTWNDVEYFNRPQMKRNYWSLDGDDVEPLGDNGGPTWTHALRPTSSAIGAAGETCPEYDQRGTARTDGGCDLGAYEADFPPIILEDALYVSPATEDGALLSDGELTASAISQFFLSFSEDMFDPSGDVQPNDVTNPLNYLLIEAGTDQLITSTCGTGQLDDDVKIPLEIAFSQLTNQLTATPDKSLVDGHYRFLICGANLQDLTGDSLDVDLDGLGNDTFSRDFTVQLLQTGIDLTVTTTEDSSDGICGINHCSLREAVIAGNMLSEATIYVPAGSYRFTLAGYDDVGMIGDLDVTGNLTILGEGTQTTIIDANRLGGVFEVHTGYLELADLTIRGGDSYVGSGIRIHPEAQALLMRLSIEDNLAEASGAGVYAASSTGWEIHDSVVINNHAQGYGGGIYAAGPGMVSNTTITGNSAYLQGGGVLNARILTLENVTITNNTADADNDGVGSGGGLVTYYSTNYPNPMTTLSYTILSGNHDLSGIAPDCGNNDHAMITTETAFKSAGYNLVSDLTGCTPESWPQVGDQAGVDPLLAAYALNGSHTVTHALQSGSPALDVGGNDCQATDQRGVPRTICDSGAFEYTPVLVSDIPLMVVDAELHGSGQSTIKTVAIQFNQPPGDVQSTASYRFVSPGIDQIFQTATCNSATSDDELLSIVEVDYNQALFTIELASLDLLDYVGTFRLLVCDNLTNELGVSLDGDFDGLPGGVFLADLPIDEAQPGPVYSVTTTDDHNDGLCGVLDCTLREASEAFNQYPGSPIIDLGIGAYIVNQGYIVLSNPNGGLIQGVGSSNTLVDGQGANSLLHLDSPSIVVADLTLQNGFSSGQNGIGGAVTISQMTGATFVRVHFKDNMAGTAISPGPGGAIYTSGNLTVVDSQFIGNIGYGGGGAIATDTSPMTSIDLSINRSTFDNNHSFSQVVGGGAIDIESHSDAFIEHSLFTNNSALFGSAIRNRGGNAVIENSTFVNNLTTDNGGAISSAFDATTLVRFSTITENSSSGFGGAISSTFDGELTLISSIVYNNGTTPCSDSSSGTGELISGGYNLIDPAYSCAFTSGDEASNVTGNPILGSLQNNGGPTLTMLPDATSLIADKVLTGYCPETDQRGAPRPQGSACDIGAIERDGIVAGGDPPQVVNVVIDGSPMSPSELLNKSIDSFSIEFDQTMIYEEATNPANIILVATGANEVLETSNCQVGGDDQQYDIATIVYSHNMLSINVASLPSDTYGIVVCDTMNSVSGVALDGDGDLVAGGHFMLSFAINAPQNGPVFEVTTDLDTSDECDQTCSVREAILAANHYGDGSTVRIPAGTYIVSNGTLPWLTHEIAIEGAGPGQTYLQGTQTSTIIFVDEDAKASIQGLTIRNGGGASVQRGGAIYTRGTLHLRDCVIENSSANIGGAIYMVGSTLSHFTSANCVFQNNSAIYKGGAIYIEDRINLLPAPSITIVDSIFENNGVTTTTKNWEYGGGAIYSTLPINIERSLFHANTTGVNPGGAFTFMPGQSYFVSYLENVTFSGNSAVDGGGIYLNTLDTGDYDALFLNNLTITDNTGYGISTDSGCCIWVENSIVSGNYDANGEHLGFDIHRGVRLSGNLIIDGVSDEASNNGDPYNIDPELQPLQDNGGFTQTHALSSTSPAIGGGNTATCAGIDQRGFPRPADLACDIGAYESNFSTPTNLHSTQITSSTVDLAWHDNATDETGYEVTRGITGDSQRITIATVSSNTISFQDTTVTCEQPVSYVVVKLPENLLSNTADVLTAPCSPSDLVVTEQSEAAVTLSWTDTSISESAFNVERQEVGMSEWISIAQTNADVTNVTDSTIACSKVYNYRARGYRSADDTYSDYSLPIQVTTPECLYADLELSSTMSATQVEVSSQVVFTQSIMNLGSIRATDVTLDQLLPDGLAYVSADNPGCLSLDQAIHCSLSDIEANESVEVTIVTEVQVALDEPLTIVSSVTTSASESNIGNNATSVILTLLNQVSVYLSENALFGAFEGVIDDATDSLAIDFVLIDVLPPIEEGLGTFSITVRTDDGAVDQIAIVPRFEQGILIFEMDFDHLEPEFASIVKQEIPFLLSEALDRLIGEYVSIVNIKFDYGGIAIDFLR